MTKKYFQLTTSNQNTLYVESELSYDSFLTTIEERNLFITLVKKVNDKKFAINISEIFRIEEVKASRIGESETKQLDRLHYLGM